MKLTYNELQDEIKTTNNTINIINEQMSLADSEYELAQLAMQLDFYEKTLVVQEEVLYDTINKGRK